MSKAKKKNVESGTPYDDAFHTMLSDCSELLIPVINEIFGKSYTGEEEIRFHQNEHYMNQQDGNLEKRVTDQSFTIISKTGEEDKYLFECQSLPDSSMLIRVFEYVTQIALDDGKITGDTLEVTIPRPAILFLRSNSNTPDKMHILMHTPGGDTTFDVNVMKSQVYTLDTIFDKKLYFLLPFYIFNHEANLDAFEADVTKLDELKQEYSEMNDRLVQAVKRGDLLLYHMKTIIEMSKHVLKGIAKKYKNVREGVYSVMGGKVLEHESKTIFNEGRKEGREEGREEERRVFVMRMHKEGYKEKEIAKLVGVKLAEVKNWINSPVTTTGEDT